MERWGSWWYERAVAGLLPRDLREASAGDMTRAFAAAQKDARRAGGAAALFRLWLREAVGLLRAAYRARRPDAWTVRTTPSGPPSSNLSTLPTMDTLASDLRFAVRTFARRPGLLILSILTLSLGIGASTAMFSVIDSVLLRSLDYPEPDEVHAVYPAWPNLVGHPTMGDIALRGTWSWPELWLVDEQQEVFEQFAGYAGGAMTLTSDDARPERIGIGVASWQLFPMLGATTRMGRLFDDTDGAEGAATALLAHDAWQSRFGGDPDIVGSTLRMNGTSYTVVGVLAQEFEVVGMSPSVWLARAGSSTDPGLGNHGNTRALGRLAVGVTKERAAEEVARILQTLDPAHGVHEATVEPFQAELTRDVRPVLTILLAAAALLLLVACGNVAALLLGAGIDRERELAVRGAVGATRGRLTQ